jgi:hypothetical protein
VDTNTRKEIVAVLKRQGRADLAQHVATAAVPPALKKLKSQMFAEAKKLQRSSVALEKQAAGKIILALRDIQQAFDLLDTF